MMNDLNSPGRKKNEAEAPGQFTANGGKRTIERTGEKSRKAAGPDGPDATQIGDTFKGPHADRSEAEQ